MRFLCLHGKGTSASIFQSQTGNPPIQFPIRLLQTSSRPQLIPLLQPPSATNFPQTPTPSTSSTAPSPPPPPPASTSSTHPPSTPSTKAPPPPRSAPRTPGSPTSSPATAPTMAWWCSRRAARWWLVCYCATLPKRRRCRRRSSARFSFAGECSWLYWRIWAWMSPRRRGSGTSGRRRVYRKWPAPRPSCPGARIAGPRARTSTPSIPMPRSRLGMCLGLISRVCPRDWRFGSRRCMCLGVWIRGSQRVRSWRGFAMRGLGGCLTMGVGMMCRDEKMLVRGLRGWWSGLRLWERSFEVRRKEVGGWRWWMEF